MFATSSTGVFPWVVICVAKLLDLLHPARLLTIGRKRNSATKVCVVSELEVIPQLSRVR